MSGRVLAATRAPAAHGLYLENDVLVCEYDEDVVRKVARLEIVQRQQQLGTEVVCPRLVADVVPGARMPAENGGAEAVKQGGLEVVAQKLGSARVHTRTCGRAGGSGRIEGGLRAEQCMSRRGR